MKRIRVLEMIDQPFLGGGQINLLSIAENLDPSAFEVFVCSRDKGPLIDSLREKNIKFFSVPFSKKLNRRIIRNIVEILNHNRIDILHTHGGIAGFYGRWAARESRTSVVVHTLHGIHYLHYRNPLKKYIYILMERYFSRFTDALIFVSDEDRKRGSELKLASEEKMFVVKNGIDFLHLERKSQRHKDVMAKKKELGLPPEARIIGTIARLHRQKGLPVLLKAVKTITERFPEIKVLIIGEGPERKKIEQKVEQLKIDPWIWLMGERKDAVELLGIFDLFVLSSLWEGLPYVLLEAGFYGKPVVASDINGVRSIIRHGETGILFPPGCPQKMAQAVVNLLNNQEKAQQLGNRLKEEVIPDFSLSGMVQSVQHLYKNLIKKSRKEKKGGTSI